MLRVVASSRYSLILLTCLCFGFIACDRSSSTTSPTEDPQTEPATPEVADEQAKPDLAARQDAKAQQAQDRPLLWQIDGPNGPVYLLGTIHVGFDPKTQLPPFVWEKLDESKTFYMETDLGKVEVQAAQKAALPEGQSLDKMLSKEAWAELDRRMGGVADQFRSFKPWFIVSLLTLKMLPEGVVKGAAMDQTLHAHAAKKGMTLKYLEDPNYQLSVLEETLTIEELEDMLEDFDEQKADLAKLLEFYEQGNIEAMKTVSFKDKDEKPEMYEKLFYVRNEAWVPQIDAAIKGDGYTFFAFGAGHLLGERGVLDLLEKQGHKPYRVTTEVIEKQKGNARQNAPDTK